MAYIVIMPKQGQSVESCIISEWFKNKGDSVAVGDLLFSYETDKASFEEEAKESGILLERFFDKGDDVPCLTTVCVIGEAGESTDAYNPHLNAEKNVPEGESLEEKSSDEKLSVPVVAHEAASKPLAVSKESEPPAAKDLNEIKISPRAKKLSKEASIDYRYAEGTGPEGRIIERDIRTLEQKGVFFTPSAMARRFDEPVQSLPQGTGLGGRITTDDIAGSTEKALYKEPEKSSGQNFENMAASRLSYEEVKLTNIRKVIAKTMQASLASTAQLTLNATFDATELLNFRRKLKAGRDTLGLENITLNDMILYAVSRTLLIHRKLNAHLRDDRLLLYKHVNLGVAVDTDRGLMVPTVYAAESKSLTEISSEVKALMKACQAGTINPDLLKDGSFTVTSLGVLDIESFTPVINPPQTGILGVDNMVQRIREVDGEITTYPAMGLSLTFDHRALDGAPAARFLQDLKQRLENFTILLVK